MQSFNSLVEMLPYGDYIWTIMMFVVVLSILVFFHELGHYLAARSVGVCVEKFSIGFGKEIWGRTDKHGTHWVISLIPFGGYVQLYGGEDTFNAEKIPAKRRKEAMPCKNVYQRMWVVFAGPLANFILAFVLLSGAMMAGEKKMLPQVGELMEDGSAISAGFKVGDIIRSVDGKDVEDWMHVQDLIVETAGKPVIVVVERGGKRIGLRLTTKYKERENRLGEMVRIPYAGIAPSFEKFIVQHGVFESLGLGVVKTYEYSELILTSIGKMITGDIGADKIGGPIMIAEVAGKAAKTGVYELVMLLVVISINLGIINLFPVPMLDGGHLVFYIVEMIKGSPVSEKIQEYSMRAGMALVLLLMVFAVSNDLRRVFFAE